MIDPLNKILESSTVEDLARIVWQAGQYNTVVGKIGQLHAAFLSFRDEDKLIEAVLDAATIDKHVPYREAPAYCQIVDEIVVLLKRVADVGNPQLAHRLALAALERAERSSEDIQDGHYWEMSIDDLREFAAALI
ncbi:MAG: hypothetical protein NTV34_05810 [Proteobacteria bacterium]|nr:hypothetical protein [Pseudomonadota bacterium]